jgi:hypothetical protein
MAKRWAVVLATFLGTGVAVQAGGRVVPVAAMAQSPAISTTLPPAVLPGTPQVPPASAAGSGPSSGPSYGPNYDPGSTLGGGNGYLPPPQTWGPPWPQESYYDCGCGGCAREKCSCLRKLFAWATYCPLVHRCHWTDCPTCCFYHGFVPVYLFAWNPCLSGPGHAPPCIPKHWHKSCTGQDCYNGPKGFSSPYPPLGPETPPPAFTTGNRGDR